MLTTTQIDNGIVDIVSIDTTKFALKTDTATKEEVQTLTSAVAGKLDASPQHHHEINDIDQLSATLSNKLDITQKYSYSSILSDAEKIDYLDELKTTELEISTSKTDNGFKIITDNNGDLLIMLGNVCVARYDSSSSQWLFSNVNINEVLANHHDAIEALSNGVVPSSHTHAISDVTNLQTTLDDKLNYCAYNTVQAALNDWDNIPVGSCVMANDGQENWDATCIFKQGSVRALMIAFNKVPKNYIWVRAICSSTGADSIANYESVPFRKVPVLDANGKLRVDNMATSALQLTAAEFFNSNLSSGHEMTIKVGKENSSKNVGYFGYTYDSTSPYMSLGFYGYNRLYKFYTDKCESTNPVTITTTSQTPLSITHPTTYGTNTGARIAIGDSNNSAAFGCWKDDTAQYAYIKLLGAAAAINVLENKTKIIKDVEVNGTITGTNLASDNETRLAALEAKMDALEYVLTNAYLLFPSQNIAAMASIKIEAATGNSANLLQQITIDNISMYLLSHHS